MESRSVGVGGLVEEGVTLAERILAAYTRLKELSELDMAQGTELARVRRQAVLRRAFLADEDAVMALAIVLDICGIYKHFPNVGDREFFLAAGRKQVAEQVLQDLKII